MRYLLSLALLFAAFTTPAQALQNDLSLKYLVNAPAKANRMIILLHGYGSNEQDLFGLKGALPPGYIIISAQAPYSLGAGAYQWYSLTIANGKRDADTTQMKESRNKIEHFITQLQHKYHIPASHTYLSGFSQGAIMSYFIGITHPALVRGIAPLSGKMYPFMHAKTNHNKALRDLRIFVAHGTADATIPVEEGKAAIAHLRSLGLKPDFHTYNGMQHTISPQVLSDLNAWLKTDMAK